MLEKVKAILGSVRFWIITLGAVVVFLTSVQEHGFNVIDLLKTIEVWLGVVAGVGTADSLAQKLSGTKE